MKSNLLTTSRWAVGSSSSTTGVSWARVMAKNAFFRSPPERRST